MMKKNIYSALIFISSMLLVNCSAPTTVTELSSQENGVEQVRTPASEVVESEDMQEAEPDERASQAHAKKYLGVGNSTLVGQFNKAWAACASSCSLVAPWVFGDKRHCNKKSCHNRGQAVDIHEINCGGTVYWLARTNKKGQTYYNKTSKEAAKKKFTSIVNCINKQGMKTIWQKKDHYSHFHVEFKGCSFKSGCK